MATQTIAINQVSERSKRILDEVEKAVVGKRVFLEKLFCTILADGHVLIEDLPGLAKTLTARSFSVVLGLTFKRIQFTPDLLPADITGGYIFNRQQGSFELVKGPIFANLVLGDEINRAPAKTQAAMLEAMQERQVTLEGETFPLPQPFVVLATQNPIEYEGTFPLPEAQLDRFMVRLSVGYPSAEEELEMLRRRWERREDEVKLERITDVNELNAMRQAVETVYIEPDVARYIVSLVQASRTTTHVSVGASPRASLALLKLSRAKAAVEGRDYVLPDDVKFIAREVFMHRILLKPDLWATGSTLKEVVESVIRNVPVPKVE
ncbi:MAG: AAA family ATPase [Thermodesulfobacteriota bacterium]